MAAYVADPAEVKAVNFTIKDVWIDALKYALQAIEKHDTDYQVREGLVYQALFSAHSAGFSCGFRLDPDEPEWPVAYIDLPTGQVSWHMPQFAQPYDGHTTEEKYQRIREFCAPKARS